MATFGRDTPMERPNPGGRAAVFVPHPEAEEAVANALNNGSGHGRLRQRRTAP